ncbi:hypothetical protein PVL29_008610 [Vitis rotundifolia]|uniref:Uncharacterized protein n=1 Tax=Vitis rotundifolia TaxID=103349 RepID=A0AA38ZWH6_VITRO|nr:hypothetical protein PVL29_008610 [Vitis rotundifolia]
MTEMVGITTTQLVWNTVERMFTTTNPARIMELRFMLQNTKKGGKKMMDHILKIEGIANNLATVGEKINNIDNKTCIF